MSSLPMVPIAPPAPTVQPHPQGTPDRPSPASRFRRIPGARYTRRVLCLLPLLLIGIWAADNWQVLHDGALQLTTADPGWLAIGGAFTLLCWVSAAFARQGAIPERLPPGLLLASQFAAGAANNVLPAGLGAHAVTLRFLTGRGIPLARATASLALYSLVKPVAKLLVILVLLATFPTSLATADLLPDQGTLLPIAVGVVAAVVVVTLVLALVRPLRRPLLNGLRTALTDARRLHTRPVRVAALWGGAAGFSLCQAAVLACVGASLGLPIAWPDVLFAYLAASAAVGAVPAPAGIGPVDAALVFTLAAMGAPLSLAAATVVGFRVLTVWLPLLPGALVLSLLVRAKVL
ncbi:lysylphosphatidylglycerol synthase domain-containing protein [Streptomyces lacrimifluminis]|uniref:Membrane protein n=1 Tax=Streptomyces lacrimifluminis TaxID=1500077 RepID=A0A917P044_9ACTN|nr:YbhN family protein [Streptomyces lacrimifluminis]GGJ46518.1 membrane protein [Streptomyces lacrimifluminis]